MFKNDDKISNPENSQLVPEKVLAAFGVKETPVLLTGGQGGTYLSGEIVFKKTDHEEEFVWAAEVLNSIEQVGFRVPKYLQTNDGKWIRDGWSACEFVQGEHKRGFWKEKFLACEAFHQALVSIPCPDFLSKRNNPWSIADRVVWGEQTIKHDPRLQEQLDRLLKLLKSLDLPSQLIHGDFTGNVLFDDKMSPAIIDFSPYFRPKDFAKAIIVVDAMVWEGADESILDLVKDVDQIDQLIIRAEMRRLIEIEECIKYFGKGSLEDIEAHKPLVRLISTRFA